jgi:hypothetical protein
MFECNISSMETASGWSREWSPDINDVKPDGYNFVQTPNGIRLYCAGSPYAGWLAKFVSTLIYPFPKISFIYQLVIDDATTKQAQIIETDSKITDASGWTYDFSAQWNIQEGWMFQVDNTNWTWTDTGIKIPPTVNEPLPVKIDYLLDYTNHTSSIAAVTAGGTTYNVPSSLQGIPAKQVGWLPSSIVVQLQQCNNHLAGAHSQGFRQINYAMSV